VQTLHGIRFVPVARVRGTFLGLDARWLGRRGLLLSLLVVLVSPAGPLSHEQSLPLALRCAIGLLSIVAVLLTSLGHELGHALAGALGGVPIRAIVLAPDGGMTIRGTSEMAHVNLTTALAGPLANLLLGSVCLWLASLGLSTLVGGFLLQLGVLQLLTAALNLLPVGPLDGSRILAAWRALD